MSVRIKQKDNGYEKMRERLRLAAKGSGVSVGVHASEGGGQHGDVASGITKDSAGRHHLNGKFISEKKATELKAKASKASHATVLDVAYWNEFGLGVPQRAFLRTWFEQADAQNRNLMRNAMKLVIRGGKTLDEALELVGLKLAGDLQKAIAGHSLGLQEDSPETVKRKGSSTPLIDSGQLRQSITHLMRGSGNPP